ncbi:uncharacterized protein LOC105165255 [Sesamum indicum]|uniref:Uncharacterized protein LOC105165255 n=1 Tax=Sesamum indicum TaxID=4182 RepID=A0A6I9TF61_SESIN|nr:uncharacterized protein LOC105165255 [Sesamum indicum]XP_020550462.1 uncharacterized protein LOC105165255 [Sesamum indicum]
MKASEIPMKEETQVKREEEEESEKRKPLFRPAKDDTKPLLQDPILRSDPIETEEAVLRLPPIPDCIKSQSRGGL